MILLVLTSSFGCSNIFALNISSLSDISTIDLKEAVKTNVELTAFDYNGSVGLFDLFWQGKRHHYWTQIGCLDPNYLSKTLGAGCGYRYLSQKNTSSQWFLGVYGKAFFTKIIPFKTAHYHAGMEVVSERLQCTLNHYRVLETENDQTSDAKMPIAGYSIKLSPHYFKSFNHLMKIKPFFFLAWTKGQYTQKSDWIGNVGLGTQWKAPYVALEFKMLWDSLTTAQWLGLNYQVGCCISLHHNNRIEESNVNSCLGERAEPYNPSYRRRDFECTAVKKDRHHFVLSDASNKRAAYDRYTSSLNYEQYTRSLNNARNSIWLDYYTDINCLDTNDSFKSKSTCEALTDALIERFQNNLNASKTNALIERFQNNLNASKTEDDQEIDILRDLFFIGHDLFLNQLSKIILKLDEQQTLGVLEQGIHVQSLELTVAYAVMERLKQQEYLSQFVQCVKQTQANVKTIDQSTHPKQANLQAIAKEKADSSFINDLYQLNHNDFFNSESTCAELTHALQKRLKVHLQLQTSAAEIPENTGNDLLFDQLIAQIVVVAKQELVDKDGEINTVHDYLTLVDKIINQLKKQNALDQFLKEAENANFGITLSFE